MAQTQAGTETERGACTVGQLITGAYLTLNYFLEPPNQVVAMWPAKRWMHSESQLDTRISLTLTQLCPAPDSLVVAGREGKGR